jgi:hypothetical protein
VVLCGRERAHELIACEHHLPAPPAGVPQLRKRLPYPGPALGPQLPTPDAGRSKRPPDMGAFDVAAGTYTNEKETS